MPIESERPLAIVFSQLQLIDDEDRNRSTSVITIHIDASYRRRTNQHRTNRTRRNTIMESNTVSIQVRRRN
jgi:hypothetical protein